MADTQLNDPGSARYGNFINYYSFNPAENRIKVFPDYTKVLNHEHETIICLDIGCNVGELSQVLIKNLESLLKNNQTHKQTVNMLAVDLDQHLIDRANGSNQNQSISFHCADVLSDSFTQLCDNYLRQHNRQNFDVVFCFSTTMWIHVNHGDEILKEFIVMLSKLAEVLVIEPQPWKCYTRAVRRMKKSGCEPFEKFGELKVRANVEAFINSVLVKECGFVRFQTAPSSWNRLISFYKKVKV